MSDAVAHIEQSLRVTTQQRPYLSIAAAASVGYVLGGGLPGWAARAAASVAIRAVVNAAVRHALTPTDTTPQRGTS